MADPIYGFYANKLRDEVVLLEEYNKHLANQDSKNVWFENIFKYRVGLDLAEEQFVPIQTQINTANENIAKVDKKADDNNVATNNRIDNEVQTINTTIAGNLARSCGTKFVQVQNAKFVNGACTVTVNLSGYTSQENCMAVVSANAIGSTDAFVVGISSAKTDSFTIKVLNSTHPQYTGTVNQIWLAYNIVLESTAIPEVIDQGGS